MIYLFGAVLLLFAFALLGRRRRRTGAWVDGTLIVTWVVTILAEVIGTIARVSGVVLTIPVAVLGVAVVARSKWKLGDISLLVLVSGIGLGVATLIDGALHPDTGSYADQGAIWLIALGVALGLIALGSSFLTKRRSGRSSLD